MLQMIVESFFSKIEKKLLELAVANTMRDINHHILVETLKRNSEELNARALDIEDEIKNVELSGQKKRKREVEKWLEKVKELQTEIFKLEGEIQSEGFVSRFLGEGRAAKLKERVVELVEQSRHFGELALEAFQTRGEELLATNLVGKAFEENLERIWKFLIADDVKSIGIYGMGGVGKTTLTKHINNRLIETTKKCVIWVTVSHKSNIRILQNKIAHVVGIDLSNEYNENKRAARLYRALSSAERENFVLILDDVWRNINLEKVGIPIGLGSSKLIITTRSLQVCRQIGCQQVILLKTLDKNEAWKLFSDTLGQEATLSPQVEEIAKSMAKLCDGLPLGIITLAGSMRGEPAIHVWRNALEELRKSVMEHEDMEDHVFKVLKYSFDHLNPKHGEQGSNGGYTQLQHCFLYCSLYPEGYEIPKEELVRKFISEELVDKRKTRRAQIDQGLTILDRLVNISLLESTAKNDCVKMHDLVRTIALKITRGKNIVLASCLWELIPNEDEEYWIEDVEKMSLMRNNIKEMSLYDGMSPKCPKLSTLLLQGNEYLKFTADSFFSQMHGLCVLDLSECKYLTKLPNSLSDLESLKTLLLGHCRTLVDVPYLGKLKALKELDLSFTAIEEMPQGMDELVNLKFLSVDKTEYLRVLPRGLLLNFPYLQCLHLPCQIEAPIIEIESMRKLEDFKGRVHNAADFNRLLVCRSLIRYCIIIMPSFLEDSEYNGSFLEDPNFLLEDVAMLAPDAQHLALAFCKGLSKSLLDNFPNFNNRKSLKSLEIRYCGGLECILGKNGELESHSTVAPLGTLQEISLNRLSDFMGIIQKEGALPTGAQDVFSSLRELVIEYCHKMKNLGLTGSEFPNLESITIDSCEEIEEIIEEGGVVSFPKLKWLTLLHLPKLKHVGTTTICHSIGYIQIQGCPALKKLPLYFPSTDTGESSISSYSSPPTLKGIYLHTEEKEWWESSNNVSYSPPPALKTISLLESEKEWWESLDWEHPSHKLLLQPFLKFTLLLGIQT